MRYHTTVVVVDDGECAVKTTIKFCTRAFCSAEEIRTKILKKLREVGEFTGKIHVISDHTTDDIHAWR